MIYEIIKLLINDFLIICQFELKYIVTCLFKTCKISVLLCWAFFKGSIFSVFYRLRFHRRLLGRLVPTKVLSVYQFNIGEPQWMIHIALLQTFKTESYFISIVIVMTLYMFINLYKCMQVFTLQNYGFKTSVFIAFIRYHWTTYKYG